MTEQIRAGLAKVRKFAVVAVPAAISAGAARAADVDVSAVTSAIDGASNSIGKIGGAVLLVIVGIKIYQWIRRAM